ncbi:nacht domain-containing protein [Xylariaceae sp. FL1651]|nr:nacht domain-containing protein [Xylariaceae sp. FL1651]
MLIYNDWHNLIVEFRKHGALDSRLPLSENDAVMITGRPIGRRLAQEVQWAFCPYVFPENMWRCHHQVDRKMILPFICAEQIGSGAFSVVEKISILPSQQNFMDKRAVTVQVVRKRLNIKGKTQDFEREGRCLRLLNQLQHPNIIPLLGSYTHREEQNFLFPYIDMDLGNFLMSEARHRDFRWDFTFYSALAGLSSALSKTHRLHLNQADHDVDFEAIGYHHDLRPPNILVSADTFVLADFGLGSLKWAEEMSHTPYKSISGDYIAPECTDRNENPQTVNRAIDVWAFGCLIAEVVTYMLKGAEGVREFRAKRLTPGRFPQWKDASFYQPHGDVKQEVSDWMETLRRDHPHPDLVPRLIKIALDALQPDTEIRPDMGTIHQCLATLSMQKHFKEVQDMFKKVQGTEAVLGHTDQRHLEGFRYAHDRFADNVFTHAFELSESCVKIMKSLFHEMTKEPKMRSLGDSSGLFALQQLAVQNVENLWKSLPDNLLQAASNHWSEELSKRQFDEQGSSPSYVAPFDHPTAQPTTHTNALESEFEEAARQFTENLPSSIPLNELRNIKSSNDVYDITDKIQRSQHENGGLRNLSKIRLYLERLEGYTTVINEVIHGNQDLLALLWGPIALLLQWARALDGAYDSLISAVAEIGKILPDFQASASILNRNIETKEITVLFFKDFLSFYHEALQPFARPSKTVVSSAIVDRLRAIQEAKIAYTFLTYQEVKTSALSTIHTLIFQLAGRDEDLIDIICESMCEGLRSNLTTAGDLLISLIHYGRPVYFVIDGVDEVSEVERGRLVTELLRLAKACKNLRVIMSARPEADLVRLVADTAVVINVHDENEGNIQKYIDERTEHIFSFRNVFPTAQIVIRKLLEPLASRAKGMFLYARLIMDMVATLHDLSEIQKELAVLPESLDAA